MESLKDTLIRYGPYVGSGILVLGATVLFCKRKRKSKPRVCGVDYPRDTVIIHQVQKGKFVPSIGQFIMKLETYLRIAKIPYEPYHGGWDDMGPKGNVPWIEYNGIEMGDSQLIIEFLNKEFNVDLNKHLTAKERATAWAIQKWLEEFTYWLTTQIRWVIFYDDFYSNYTDLPYELKGVFSKWLQKMLHTVGVGRHSKKEVKNMMSHDVKMLSELLGDKKFLMGDQPTELDCAAFGILSQIRWISPDGCPGKTLLKNTLVNVSDYTERIKNLYWPDWNDRITSKPQ